MTICPKCGSRDAKTYVYDNAKLTACDKCGYDEADAVEQESGTKTPTKHRQAYKVGGSGRTRK